MSAELDQQQQALLERLEQLDGRIGQLEELVERLQEDCVDAQSRLDLAEAAVFDLEDGR